MPRVGSSMMMISGSASMILASISFCWLPPDSWPARTDGSRVRMSKRRTARSSVRASLAVSTKIHRRWRQSVSKVRLGRSPIFDEKAFALAVFRHVGEARLHRLRDIGEMGGLASDDDLARCAVPEPGDSLGNGSAPRADEPGETENLALAQLEGDVDDSRCVQIADREHQRRVDVGFALGGIEVREFATDHHLRGRIRRQRVRTRRSQSAARRAAR